jgi:hypothetical protein
MQTWPVPVEALKRAPQRGLTFASGIPAERDRLQVSLERDKIAACKRK